jgi:hypothetical protein
MPSTDTKPELTAKASMAQPVSQPAVYANGLILSILMEILLQYVLQDLTLKFQLSAQAFFDFCVY